MRETERDREIQRGEDRTKKRLIERGAQKETDRERMIEGERGNIEKGEEMQTKKR